jgi:hypothetical protein
MRDSQYYKDWYDRVVRPPRNDFLTVISPSSKSAVSGTGKTTMGVGIGKRTDTSRSGFDADAQFTLNAGEFAYDIIPDSEPGSAVGIDEAQGTPGEGSGLNSKRAMKTTTMEAIGSVLANRDQHYHIIVIVQDFSSVTPDLYPAVDAWLLIRHGPGEPKGPLATYHKVHTDDYDLGSNKVKTPAIEDVSWPPLPKSDPDYKTMEQKKQKAKEKQQEEDEDAPLAKDTQASIAQTWRDQGYSPRWIADNVDDITYSYSWVYDHTEAPADSDDSTEAQTA